MFDPRPYRLHLLGALLALLSAFAVLLYAALGEKEPALAQRLSADFAPLPVRPESLFPPAEPEIVPPALLSREPRSGWTAADAAPFWTDPGAMQTAPLEAAAKAEIDRLFGSVP